MKYADIVKALIVDKAKERMAETGQFRYDDVTEASGVPGLSAYVSLLPWQDIRFQVEEALGEKLTPLVARTNGGWDPQIHPEKFLPSRWRPTIGWARASTQPHRNVALKFIQRRHKSLVGQAEGFDKLAESFQRQGLLRYHPGNRPILELPTSEAAE